MLMPDPLVLLILVSEGGHKNVLHRASQFLMLILVTVYPEQLGVTGDVFIMPIALDIQWKCCSIYGPLGT